LSPKTQIFPVHWHEPISFEALGTIESVGRRTTQIHIGTHSGTHVDAPSHFIIDGITIDSINLEHFLGTAISIDLTNLKSMEVVHAIDLEKIAQDDWYGRILIFHFGWSRYFGSENYYVGQPYFSLDACKYLLTFSPKAIGYDLAMPDNPKDGYAASCDSPAHKLLLGAGVPLIENLKISQNLPIKFEIACFPLKLVALDGSPVRCVGWINE
jgi:arylformamidase